MSISIAAKIDALAAKRKLLEKEKKTKSSPDIKVEKKILTRVNLTGKERFLLMTFISKIPLEDGRLPTSARIIAEEACEALSIPKINRDHVHNAMEALEILPQGIRKTQKEVEVKEEIVKIEEAPTRPNGILDRISRLEKRLDRQDAINSRLESFLEELDKFAKEVDEFLISVWDEDYINFKIKKDK